MGQYWTIWNLTKNQSLYPSSFGSLLKLVEIAYTFPGPVGALVVMLLPGGPWAGDRIVFSGDYDEQEEWWDNPRTEVPAVEDVSNQVPGEVKGWKYYPPPIPPGTYTLVNLDKNEKVQLSKLPWKQEGVEPPLLSLPVNVLISALLASPYGNGKGGGDFPTGSTGHWAGQRVMIVKDEDAPADAKDITKRWIRRVAWLITVEYKEYWVGWDPYEEILKKEQEEEWAEEWGEEEDEEEGEEEGEEGEGVSGNQVAQPQGKLQGEQQTSVKEISSPASDAGGVTLPARSTQKGGGSSLARDVRAEAVRVAPVQRVCARQPAYAAPAVRVYRVPAPRTSGRLMAGRFV